MDRCSPQRLKLMLKLQLTVFLLASTKTDCLHGNHTTGVSHNLHCLNNYLFTVHCSLSIADTSDGSTSYWLSFTETDVPDPKTFDCRLTNTDGDYVCSANKTLWTDDEDSDVEMFSDSDLYEISLCHNQSNHESETCEVLNEGYMPEKNIKLNAPCCLSVSHNSSQLHFTWMSTYEKYAPFTQMVASLQFQLCLDRRGDKQNMTPRVISTDSKSFSVYDDYFEPDTDYAARVRSSPEQAFYQGEWSDWSPEVHWRTGPPVGDVPPTSFISGLGKVVIPLCVVMTLLLFLCYAPVKKWKQGAFIPTPAPYFHTLYSDCQGDFKSWVVLQENTADMLKAEETLQINTLTKCDVVQDGEKEEVEEEKEECQPQFHLHFSEGSTYSNITDPGCDTFLLGIPYAVSTMSPLAAPGSSFKSLTLSSLPGSPAEGDSGCWLSLERDPPFYCNEYCTLSAFQQTSPVTAEHHGGLPTKSCRTGVIRVDAVTEA